LNSKIRKYRQEREKNAARISRLTARNEKLDELIMQEENNEIIAAVRARNMNAEQLTAFVRELHEGEAPVFHEEMEEKPDEE
jgi:DNA repair ATPase RecN